MALDVGKWAHWMQPTLDVSISGLLTSRASEDEILGIDRI